MADFPIYVRTARGTWRIFETLDAAVAGERRVAGDRRGKTELWKLFEGVWLYVGPRPRRNTTRHVAHLLTANGATLLGVVIPESLRFRAEATR